MKQPAFEEIISPENLFLAWKEFLRGKSKRSDVVEFSMNLSRNIFDLYHDLKNKKYIHGIYHSFNISDPKPRNIHKASVRDRLLHHAMYRALYTYFDSTFIYDSYSCRKWKGTHRAVKRFEVLAKRASLNYTKTLWILKCDVRKFFASIDHEILFTILHIFIEDDDIVWLLKQIVKSFSSTTRGKGLPLGNLTSQLLVNVYMNWLDQYMKHSLRAKYYIRYADDFVIMHTDKLVLEEMLTSIKSFLSENLLLDLHPEKVFIKTHASGVDFLGWVHFPRHRVLRTVTKRRMMKRIKETGVKKETVESYMGLLKYGNAYKLRRNIENDVV